MGICVGIDLGTTFSVVARINEQTGKPEIIKNSFGNAITPSVLCFEPNGTILFGDDAKNMQAAGDTNTAAFFKRFMGNETYLIEYLGQSYTAADLSAIFLKKLVAEAQEQIGEQIDSAVITVPAYFTHKERQATMEAGQKAGLHVLSIINEPTAAAFSYGLNKKESEQTVLIYDLGGGTFDVTIAGISQDNIKILGSDGNHELGGKDWDDCIARYLVQEFTEQYGVDLSEDSRMTASLIVTAEQVKKQLTARDEVIVPINYGEISGSIIITEEIFESISGFLIGTTKDVTERLLQAVKLRWSDIDGVILVGGSTRMRMIHNYVTQMSGKAPLSGINVDEAVALGAAIKANIDPSGKSTLVPTLSIGGLHKNRKSTMFIQGAKALSDVTAHALGMISISADGKRYVNSVIIHKNTPIPTANTRSYNFRPRARDNELEVYVLQGEYERPLDNTIIDKYVITQIEKTSGSSTIIDVHYRYTLNGVIEVSATQKETGKNLPVRITPIPGEMNWTDSLPEDNEEEYAQTVEVLLAVDLSGSMRGNPTLKAQAAMNDFVGQMGDMDVKIGIIGFAVRSKCLLEPTSNLRDVRKTIGDLKKVNLGLGTSAEPFTTALPLLQGKRVKKVSDIRYIIVLTDGQWYNARPAIAAAKMCHREGIQIIALGFGAADYNFLKQIASMDDYASITNLSELSGSFSKIAREIGASTSIKQL